MSFRDQTYASLQTEVINNSQMKIFYNFEVKGTNVELHVLRWARRSSNDGGIVNKEP